MSRLGGGGGKWHPPAPLLLEKSPNIPCASSTYSQISKQISLLHAPDIFQNAAAMLSLHLVGCYVVSLRAGTPFPLALLDLLELSPLVFKVLHTGLH